MILEIKDLVKKYKKKVALNHVSYEMKDGIYALLGPNGAGKSTLMKILTGTINKTSGQIIQDGKPIEKITPEYLSKVGYMPQAMAFYPNYTGREFLEYMAMLKGIKKEEGEKLASSYLEMVNLAEQAEQKIKSYSGGMKQRLGIAQSLLNNPSLLIFDEPTAGLDPRERIRFRNILSKLSKDRIIIIATHIVSDVDLIADKILMLKQGVLVENGTGEELKQKLYGKIWNIKSEEGDISWLKEGIRIFNISRVENELIYRVYSETAPTDNAVLVRADLEDVYLFYFEDEEIDVYKM